jgi:hypothetical protein
MQLLVRVEILQAKQQLANHNGNVVLPDQARLHEVGTAPARAELHDNPQLGALGVGAIVFGDVGRLQLREDGNLLDDVLDLVLGALNVNDLDGDRLAGALVHTVEKGY